MEAFFHFTVLLFLLQVPNIVAVNVTYFRPDGTLSLRPTAVPGPIKSILWRHGDNLVAEWIKDAIDLQYYGIFLNRTELNIEDGLLKITRTTEADNGVFSVEINNVAQEARYEARMIQKVPDPNVWVKPGPNQERYVLYCDPDPGQQAVLKDAQPVSYQWKIGTAAWVEFGSKLEINVNETTLLAETFMCRMVNPVSDKSSGPKKNPFYGQRQSPDSPKPDSLGVGLGVLAVLLLSGGVWLVYAFKKKKFPFHQRGHVPVNQIEKEMESTP